VRELRGDSEGALAAYREAERTTGELLQRAPQDPQRMFDHAQAVFFVGQTAWMRKDWPTAEARFRTYARLADAMAATDLTNLKWVAEQGYSASTLGALFLSRGQPAEAADQFRRYVAAADRGLAASPQDPERLYDSGQARAWLADALVELGDLAGAKAAREAEQQRYAAILTKDPRNAEAQLSSIVSLDGLAQIEMKQGSNSAAVARAAEAVALGQDLLSTDPDNTLWRDVTVSALNSRVEALMASGRWNEARTANRLALGDALRLVATDTRNEGWRTGRLMPARWMEIAIARALDVPSRAAGLEQAFRNDFASYRSVDLANGANMSWVMVEAMAALDAEQRGAPAEAEARRQAARKAAGSSTSAAGPREVLALLDRPRAPIDGRVAAYDAAAILLPGKTRS
jgi:tetratricopeptide (TPR) repeat protein